MAIGVVRLTKAQRRTLAFIEVGLLSTQSLLGSVITGWSIYICIVISPTLYSEKSEITFVFTVTGMYGTHVLFHNLTGIKVCHTCYMKAHKKRTRTVLFIWILAGCNTIINILILAAMAAKISKHMVRSMRHSMEKGMIHYLKDPYWKTTIDRLQTKMKCCGVTGYKDWHQAAWINEHQVNMEHPLVKGLRTSQDRLHLPVIPWSCCRTDFPMQCFHDPLQQVQSAYLWKEQPATVTESVFEDGCLVLLRQPLETALVGFIFMIGSILFLQIVSVAISRILFTSCRNAVILGNLYAKSPGWIFGRGDCGWTRGPGLYELLENTPVTRTTSADSKVAGQSNQSSIKATCSKDSRSCRSQTSRSEEEPISSAEEENLMLY